MRGEPIKAGVAVFVVIMIRMIVMMVVTVLMLPWKMSNLDEAARPNHENEEGDDEGGRAGESNPSLGRTQIPEVGNHHQDPKYLFESRLGICRDRRDRRSCKIFVSCVNFSRKQRSLLYILQVYTHINVNFLHNC